MKPAISCDNKLYFEYEEIGYDKYVLNGMEYYRIYLRLHGFKDTLKNYSKEEDALRALSYIRDGIRGKAPLIEIFTGE